MYQAQFIMKAQILHILATPLSGNQFMFFCKGTWKNTLYVHFKCILLHSRIFAVLVHWEISKKNGNWKQNVPNSCTVHKVFMILKSILKCFSIQTLLSRKDLMVYWFCCWSFTRETGDQFPEQTQIIFTFCTDFT